MQLCLVSPDHKDCHRGSFSISRLMRSHLVKQTLTNKPKLAGCSRMFRVTTDKQTCPVGEIFGRKNPKSPATSIANRCFGNADARNDSKEPDRDVTPRTSLTETCGREDRYVQIACWGVSTGGDLRSSLDRSAARCIPPSPAVVKRTRQTDVFAFVKRTTAFLIRLIIKWAVVGLERL